ncbi:phasin family protein [Alicyclobacillus pomorum]|jgi:polyhydroxyalkanoate synthesis regulator phasin|uniref:phasin family protein n=1 Tax=Alicyclobacillus pomorum TaxID=204470 RepID=UPI00041AE0E7|nr:hypothetical protein [Alicyclobacillus pomorum]
MEDFLKTIADLGIGMISIGREKLEAKIKEWTDSGQLSAADGKRLLNTIVERGEQERAELQRMIQEQVQKTLSKMGVLPKEAGSETETVDPAPVTAEYIQQLEARIAELEKKLNTPTE